MCSHSLSEHTAALYENQLFLNPKCGIWEVQIVSVQGEDHHSRGAVIKYKRYLAQITDPFQDIHSMR